MSWHDDVWKTCVAWYEPVKFAKRDCTETHTLEDIQNSNFWCTARNRPEFEAFIRSVHRKLHDSFPFFAGGSATILVVLSSVSFLGEYANGWSELTVNQWHKIHWWFKSILSHYPDREINVKEVKYYNQNYKARSWVSCKKWC